MKNAYTLVKESNRLTRQAKHIFGDIIDRAYFGAVTDSSMEDYFNGVLYELSDQKDTSKDLNSIDIGCLVVVIKFTNGKIVKFNSSEWGDIEGIKDFKNYSPDKVGKE